MNNPIQYSINEAVERIEKWEDLESTPLSVLYDRVKHDLSEQVALSIVINKIMNRKIEASL